MTEQKEPPSDLMPVSIDREGPSSIRIEWNDRTTTHWTIGQLRKACPCATCREKKKGDQEDAADKMKDAGGDRRRLQNNCNKWERLKGKATIYRFTRQLSAEMNVIKGKKIRVQIQEKKVSNGMEKIECDTNAFRNSLLRVSFHSFFAADGHR